MTKIVFCDVEGTLLRASFPLLVLEHGQRSNTLTRWQMAQARSLGVVGQTIRGGLGRAVQMAGVIRAIAGSRVADVEHVLDLAMPDVLAALKPEMVARLRKHQSDGYQLVLLSAGLHAGIVRLANALGGRGEGTKLRIVNGRYTGQIDGAICQGKGKALRATAVLREVGARAAECIAYGDTGSDAHYLALMSQPHAVDPDSALTKVAALHGWPIIHTATVAESFAPDATPDTSPTSSEVEEQAQAALRQFVTPRRTPLRPKEAALLASATPLVFRNGLVGASWGGGPTIALVHGWEGRGVNLGAFIDPLVAAGFRVVTLDGPAHGDSPGTTTDPLDFALRLKEVGSELGSLAGIVAHSMGAASTMLAVQRGLQVRRVALIAGPASLFGVVRRFAQMQQLPEAVATRFFALMRERVGTDDAALEIQNVVRDITIPGLIIHDRKDAEVPFADAEAIAAAWPTAQLRVVEGRGHRRILLAPEVVVAAVDFLTAPVAKVVPNL